MLFQAIRIKLNKEGAPWVEAPSRTWAAVAMKRSGVLKSVSPSPLEMPRHEASTRGNIKAWFDKIQEKISPERC